MVHLKELLGQHVLNAFRHLMKDHWWLVKTAMGLIVCSTPFGI